MLSEWRSVSLWVNAFNFLLLEQHYLVSRQLHRTSNLKLASILFDHEAIDVLVHRLHLFAFDFAIKRTETVLVALPFVLPAHRTGLLFEGTKSVSYEIHIFTLLLIIGARKAFALVRMLTVDSQN